ncbi:MAG: SCP-2 sterol transfer family protein [Ruminococcaceae bacterium]|nr:SCP-2 sterol transfer family protein [Oscillospiraceae bacterium]
MATKKTTKTETKTAPVAEVKAEPAKKETKPAAKKPAAKKAETKATAKKTTTKKTAAKKPVAKKTTKKAENNLPDIVTLADMLRAKVEKKDASAINEKIAIQIKVYGEYENYMYILVDNGVVTVEPYGYLDNDIHIDMPIEDVISVINDKYDFKAKALSGDFYVLGSLTKLLKVKEALF